MNGAKMEKKNLLRGNRHFGWPNGSSSLILFRWCRHAP